MNMPNLNQPAGVRLQQAIIQEQQAQQAVNQNPQDQQAQIALMQARLRVQAIRAELANAPQQQGGPGMGVNGGQPAGGGQGGQPAGGGQGGQPAGGFMGGFSAAMAYLMAAKGKLMSLLQYEMFNRGTNPFDFIARGTNKQTVGNSAMSDAQLAQQAAVIESNGGGEGGFGVTSEAVKVAGQCATSVSLGQQQVAYGKELEQQNKKQQQDSAEMVKV